MKTKLYHLILFLLVIFTAEISAQSLILKNQQMVITMGNSITEQGEQAHGYVSIMRKTLDALYPERTVYIVNVGISGHKSNDMLARFERDVLQYQPAWVTISVGVNDVWHGFRDGHSKGDGPRGMPLDQFSENVTAMVQRAQTAGINVALFTTTVIKENLSSPENIKLVAYNKALRKIARQRNCLLIDMDNAFRNALNPHQQPGMSDRGVLTYDGVHMLPAGNWLMAKTALVAFGVPEERIDLIKPQVEKVIIDEKQSLEQRLARYKEINYEVGAPRTDEQRLVFFGSSSVDLWNLAENFPTVSFLNRGIGGETTRQMMQRFRQDVVKLNPYAAIIFLGSCNDFWHDKKIPPAETKSNLMKMARLADWHQIKVAIGAISPVNDYLPGKDFIESHPIAEVIELNQWIKQYCKQNEHIFIDFFSAVADSNLKLAAQFTGDGMHCNATGYAQWKPLVIQALKEMNIWKE